MTPQRMRIVTSIVLVACLINAVHGIYQLLSPLHLVGTTWELQHYGDPAHLQPAHRRALNGSVPTLEFAGATINGSTGCNSFDGGYFIVVGLYLKLVVLGTTLAGCGGETMEEVGEMMWQERVYRDLLSNVYTFTRDGDKLTLITPEAILVFQRRD